MQNNKKIIIGSDHGGFELKENIKEKLKEKYQIIDVGTHSVQSCNYPVFAKKLCLEVLKNNCFGILICTTGIGMSIAANRFVNIRAAIGYNDKIAEMSRKHNNANIICFGAGYINPQDAFKRINIFLNTKFEAGRHKTRIDMLDLF